MITTTIVLDDWELPIFAEVFNTAGLSFTDKGHFPPGCRTLQVTFEEEDLHEVNAIICRANSAAANQRLN